MEVKTSNGESVYKHLPSMERALSDRVVSNLNFMLNKVVESGTGTAAKIPGQTVAGKTGTTNAYKDAWFIGYTGSMVASIWMGNDNNASSNRLTGGNLPAQTWKLVMEPALKTQPTKTIPGLTPAAQPKQPAQKPVARPVPVPEPVAPKQFEPPVVRERNFFERLLNIE
jgi:penicillin-binding protein 1A